jgi:glycosyltransferase involved in cell wall biosynthesis
MWTNKYLTGKIPIVSIGMPVYNGEEFIVEALESLLGQTFINFELIISDNASEDRTGEICTEYALRDSRIRYIRQKQNIGAVANFQFVLDTAVGEYFMWNAADDYRATDCIEYYLSRIGGAGGVFSTYARLNRTTGAIQVAKVPILSTEQSRRESLRRFFMGNRPSLFYGLYRRTVVLECLPKDTFDWSDSCFVLNVISRYGFNTENGTPKYYAGFNNSYVPKPFNGKYIHAFKYFGKVFNLAIYAGPVALLYHLNTLRITAILNFNIWKLKN